MPPFLPFLRALATLPVIFAIGFLTGCNSLSTSQLEQAPAVLSKGSTTKAEVISLYGEPDRRRIDSSGETWLYGDAHDHDTGDFVVDQAIGIGSGFIPVPYVGTAISGVRSLGRSKKSSQPSASMKFDKNGVLQDYLIDIP